MRIDGGGFVAGHRTQLDLRLNYEQPLEMALVLAPYGGDPEITRMVADLLLKFFTTDATAKGWFTAKDVARVWRWGSHRRNAPLGGVLNWLKLLIWCSFSWRPSCSTCFVRSRLHPRPARLTPPRRRTGYAACPQRQQPPCQRRPHTTTSIRRHDHTGGHYQKQLRC